MPFKELLQRIFFLQFLVIFLLVTPALAQLNSGNLFQLTEKEGLPSNLINTVFVDRMGYVWVASPNGLARYNGYDFERFYSNVNDSTALHGSIVYSMMQASDGKIWMGTNPAFIEQYDPDTRTFKSYYFENKFSNRLRQSPLFGFVTSSICEGENGVMYFGISTAVDDSLPFGLLYKIPGEDSLRVFKSQDDLAMGAVNKMRKDPSGNIWIWSQSGVFRINKAGNLSNETALISSVSLKTGDQLVDFRFDKNGHAWLLCKFGNLIKLNVENGESINYSSPYHPRQTEVLSSCLDIDQSGTIWIGREQGIEQYLPVKNEFRIFNRGIKKNLEKVFVTDFAFDDFKNVFIATIDDGLLRYEDKPVFNSILADKNPGKNIRPGWVDFIYQAEDRKIWLHSDGGLSLLDPGHSFSVSDVDIPSLQQGRCLEMWEDTPGVYVFGHADGKLLRYHSKSGKLESISLPGLPGNSVIFKYFMDQRGNVWLGTRSGLYRKAQGAGKFNRYDLSSIAGGNANSNSISDLVESSRNGLWIITNYGLFRYRYDKDSIEHHGFGKQKDEVFITQDVNSLYEDLNGTVWVGLWQGGLAKYDPVSRKIRSYTVDDGLPSMGIQSIVGDGRGNIWLSTFNGISRFDTANEKFINFSTEDGIQGSLFADVSYLQTDSGTIFFGGSNGLTYFNPRDFGVGYTEPKVYLTDLKLFGKSLKPGRNEILKRPIFETQKVVLEHYQNNLAISFIAIHYSNPNKNKYAYILENYDNGWREGTNQRQAYYPNLPPGTYTFRVKAASDKGVWNEEGAVLTIIVKSPWWQTWWAYTLYFIVTVLLVIGFIRWRTAYLQREKKSLEKKVAERTGELKTSLENLKATQAQLIQSEKMASLGELTAGIAHEIQNPLNFVNNFSDVNKELLFELQNEIKKGNTDEANAIADDVIDNEEKISHHGKRADAIVKSMLEHSRTGKGERQQTDINALCEEYLRLSYHGMRAREKDFNAEIRTDFDKSIGKINIVPQDVGRVMLNLFNNAFYAVNEKQKAFQSEAGSATYQPTVKVRTKSFQDQIQISVTDNGNGIPDSIREKIFQPFFTTKPTGSGTGLGLSLSYDIIKAHNGDIMIESEEGKGTMFDIKLPAS